MEARSQEREREMQETYAKVIAFHRDKDKAKTPIITRGYFNALCPTYAEKVRFYQTYKEKFPQDTETLKMIKEELEKQREKDADKNREKQQGQKLKKRNVALSNNAYYGDDVDIKPDKTLLATKKGWFKFNPFNLFGWFGERKSKLKPVIERVTLSTTQAERKLMAQETLFDDRLQRYNESVRQRAMSGASKSAPERVNANMMSR